MHLTVLPSSKIKMRLRPCKTKKKETRAQTILCILLSAYHSLLRCCASIQILVGTNHDNLDANLAVDDALVSVIGTSRNLQHLFIQ